LLIHGMKLYTRPFPIKNKIEVLKSFQSYERVNS
jgi:hypothetical protein